MNGFDNQGVDERLSSPAVQRNRDPILGVLNEILPQDSTVLEIASGSGEHAFHFAYHLPQVTWYPSDANVAARASISAWRAKGGPPNLRAPLALDVTRRPWPSVDYDALVCINMLHIAPWEAAEALFAEAQRLPVGGVLYLYGPFKREGSHTAPSNAAFDADLRRRDARWGIRDLETVESLGQSHGLTLERVVEMPANNLSLVFKPDVQA
ncbi:Protein of unknown function [Modicisalibacter muralis]|uniref:SAM-dependent methyltransferase n=1 Tax=Modicisalibacter muralis TaxID=119000 RepID=A0A1G9HW20_9GAMM|nr:DUF938 domain-containing protein [Halomonas muralis]SDL17151.1 Protein of unknown function [Halomonas muralis]